MTNDQGAELAGETASVDELRIHRERRIVPAGMSYERALEIAITVSERRLSRADSMATVEVHRMPRP